MNKHRATWQTAAPHELLEEEEEVGKEGIKEDEE